jgi:hypothetical protein
MAANARSSKKITRSPRGRAHIVTPCRDRIVTPAALCIPSTLPRLDRQLRLGMLGMADVPAPAILLLLVVILLAVYSGSGSDGTR